MDDLHMTATVWCYKRAYPLSLGTTTWWRWTIEVRAREGVAAFAHIEAPARRRFRTPAAARRSLRRAARRFGYTIHRLHVEEE